MKFKPLERNSGVKFVNTVVGGNIPKNIFLELRRYSVSNGQSGLWQVFP